MQTNVHEPAYTYRRSARTIAAALFRPKLYSGLIRTLARSVHPVDFLARYLRIAGRYPAQIALRSPIGRVNATVFTPDDLDTLNEIFFWDDYGSRREDRIIVDFGANIGLSTLYFLSRNTQAQSFCVEPLPQNIVRLKQNLEQFASRYELIEAAVCDHDGVADFGWEPTGKFGGVGAPSLQRIEVTAVDANRVLREIIARHGDIDLLKIDTEGTEGILTERIPPEIARRIRRIAIEFEFDRNPLPETHDMSLRWPITTLLRRDQPGA